jgi:hypothetical protein
MHLFIAIVGLPDEVRDPFMERFLLVKFRGYRIEVLKSYTTGDRRSDRDYLYHIFVTEREFDRRKGDDEFFHIEHRGDARYGFRWQDIADIMVDGHGVALFDRLPRAKAAELKTLVGELMIVNPLPDDLMPLGVGRMPQGVFFQKPDKGGGDN